MVKRLHRGWRISPPSPPGVFTARSSGVGAAAAQFVKVFASGDRQQDLTFDPATRRAVSLDLGDQGDLLFLSLFGTGMRGSAGAGCTAGSC